MITIEEAHKFLNPRAASQTIFGTIARELRKFYVTLLVVDQRPSGIDDEVLSQIGTRITCALNDDKDIDAISPASAARATCARSWPRSTRASRRCPRPRRADADGAPHPHLRRDVLRG